MHDYRTPANEHIVCKIAKLQQQQQKKLLLLYKSVFVVGSTPTISLTNYYQDNHDTQHAVPYYHLHMRTFLCFFFNVGGCLSPQTIQHMTSMHTTILSGCQELLADWRPPNYRQVQSRLVST